jgi:hypothetical protein
MFKILILLKRRPGMSMHDFIDYYESVHSKLGEKHLKGHGMRYVRRYLHSMPALSSAEVPEGEYDVVTEMWFADRAAFEASSAGMDPRAMAEIAEDEERLFDRSKTRFFTVEERESQL